MLYVKVFHVFFVTAWMAVLFYLPRILVHYAEGFRAGEDVRRVLKMGEKLHRFGVWLAIFAFGFGLALWQAYGIGGIWMNIKFLVVLGMAGYQMFCGAELKRFAAGSEPRPPLFYRIYNEALLIPLLAVLFLVIFKPF